MTAIEAGTELPPLQRAVTLTDMVAYAGATWDWHRLHYDPGYLAERGLSAPVVDGQMLAALLAEQAQDALGPSAFLRRLQFRFRNLVFAGETVRCTARVTACEGLADGTALVTLAASVGVVGADARVAVAPAHLEVHVR
ncbi:MaoC/PaaZ C-terminal domain-containing protein [Yinghuangia seranimata]|uniref:MaoC/PaaZ C-terminal domain-containing protein n=1 Tax=Yinghuangia seranimata TaxID=408067 RepID=UPI00248C6517|nr:MaoC/PaaZ C-terminal domain-containing protein [Yinghuangia seranimata]MDI2132449.1 MaoC/PaaZ C-terminal domain-containing protein [Yinghuangia seranimata]